MSPFEVTLGDNSKMEVAQRAASVQVALDQSRAMIDRHEVAINDFDSRVQVLKEGPRYLLRFHLRWISRAGKRADVLRHAEC